MKFREFVLQESEHPILNQIRDGITEELGGDIKWKSLGEHKMEGEVSANDHGQQVKRKITIEHHPGNDEEPEAVSVSYLKHEEAFEPKEGNLGDKISVWLRDKGLDVVVPKGHSNIV